MHPDARRVLARAAREIGYNRHTDPRRGSKYARETQPHLWPNDKWLLANGIAYCDIFVTWCFWKEGLLDILPAGASYNTGYRASQGGRINKSQAQPGDVLVFDWNWATASTNHVGIMEARLPSGNVQTIEGNTSPGNRGSQSNGGGVYRRVRRWNQVRYVIRPRWRTIKVIGSVGGAAKVIVPSKPSRSAYRPLAVDGKVGPATVRALQRFLRSRGQSLTVDGKAGHGTWRALQRYLRTPADGIVSSQPRTARQVSPAGSITQGWQHVGKGARGSSMVRALQKWVGVTVDGKWGPDTTRGLQRKLNAHKVS